MSKEKLFVERLGKWHSTYSHLKRNLQKLDSLLEFPDYPIKHGFSHSDRVENRLADILEDLGLEQICSLNLFILLAAIWLHDTGYGVDIVQRIRENILPELKISRGKVIRAKKIIGNTKSREEMLLLQDEYHHVLSGWFVKNRLERLIGFVDPNIKRSIALLCFLHRRRSGDILNQCENVVRKLEEENLHPELLISLLRLSDALDITSQRISEIDEYLQKLPNKIRSRPFWQACKLITSISIRGDKKSIFLEGTIADWGELQLMKWKVDDLYDEILQFRESKELSNFTKPLVYQKVFARVIDLRTHRPIALDGRIISSLSYDNMQYVKRCPSCHHKIAIHKIICNLCGKPFYKLTSIIPEEKEWENYWHDRLRDLNEAKRSQIMIASELEDKLKLLMKKTQILTPDLETAMLVAAIALFNGIATRQELCILGQILAKSLNIECLDEEASKTLELLVTKNILVPSSTNPESGATLYSMRSLDNIVVTFQSIDPSYRDYDTELRELLVALAKNKTPLKLWLFLPDGIPSGLEKLHEAKIDRCEMLETHDTYNNRVSNIIRQAESEILISLEYGTGVTKSPYNLLIEKLKEGVKVKICITPMQTSRFVTESKNEWLETNRKLRELFAFGDVQIFEVPDLYHNWHMWLSLKDGSPKEGIGFYRLGCMPFWHARIYANREMDLGFLNFMLNKWRTMVGKSLKKYPVSRRPPKWVYS